MKPEDQPQPQKSLGARIVDDLKVHPGKAALIGAGVVTAAAAFGFVIYLLRRHQPEIDPKLLDESEAEVSKKGVHTSDVILNAATDLNDVTRGAVVVAARAVAQSVEIPKIAEPFENIADAVEREQPKSSV